MATRHPLRHRPVNSFGKVSAYSTVNLQRPLQTLAPYLLLSGVSGEEERFDLKYKKAEKEAQRRFNLPIAKLVNLPPSLSQETFYVETNELNELPEDYWNEGEIAFLGLSQIKYVGQAHILHVATFLISPASLSIGFKSLESLTLQDQTSVAVQAWVKHPHGNRYSATNLFPLPEIDLTVDNQVIFQVIQSNEDSDQALPDHGFHPSFKNQIAFKKDNYIVTLSSDLELEDLKNIIEQHVTIE